MSRARAPHHGLDRERHETRCAACKSRVVVVGWLPSAPLCAPCEERDREHEAKATA